MVRRYFSLAVCLAAASLTAGAQVKEKGQNKEQERLANCGVVMSEVLNVPDNVPQEVLDKAECVIVIPSMTKVAVGLGGSYGRGAMACRSGKTFNGPWGAPAMYTIEGGSFGLQLGAESTDVGPDGHEPARSRGAARQQRQAWRRRVGIGRPQGAAPRSLDGRDDARGSPQLLALSWPVRRGLARGLLTSTR